MYIHTNPNPNGVYVEDCVVRAISIVTGRSWDDVYLNLCLQGYIMKNMPSVNNGFPTNLAPVQDDRWVFTDYVSGRAGADAYQMPNGVNRVLLFDNDTNRMFIKGYDNNGRPRVLEDNDFQPHTEPEPQQNAMPNIDMSKYATQPIVIRAGIIEFSRSDLNG